MFNKILIANRGEIACRIIKTARSMGIHSVAVYSTADRNSLHVQQADSAYCIGGAKAQDSYLNIDALIHAAKASKAEAIHPGYGFLSENTAFAKACADAGIVFIGPSVFAMDAMASKQLAKQLLEKTKVPLTPGYHGTEQAEDKLLLAAQKIGFPVLLKAANGGGGKGMRAVYKEEEFHEALAAAKRESRASFADDTMIIEKLVQNPRHIEVQIMADNYDNVVHLFERDCSVQRRHQKIIEEAPAPNLSSSLRQKIAAAACEVARSIHYRGAGTIEFLLDGEQFYFMEMNTRLQVEHPVTELITGLDLVAWQFKIAANEPLPLKQEEIQHHGHAIECRIYAEDPTHQFLPSIGTIDFLKEPQGAGIRIDTGVVCGSAISKYYDPMIAKLITYGDDREQALLRMKHALSTYAIGGLKTNIPFLQAICQHPQFKNARFSTNFLDKEEIKIEQLDSAYALALACSFDYLHCYQQQTDPLYQDTFSWQNYGTTHWVLRYIIDNQRSEATLIPINKHQFKLIINDEEQIITAQQVKDRLTVELAQQSISVFIANKPSHLTLFHSQGQITIDRFSWNDKAQQSSHKGQLTAPMPATVVAVLKNKGDKVQAGECLLILEAMKMEHAIHAPSDGIVHDVFYTVGAQVNEGVLLLSFAANEQESR